MPNRLLLLTSATVLLAGCGFGLFEDHSRDYLAERSDPPLVLPDGLGAAHVAPLLPIPDLPDSTVQSADLDPSDPRPRSLLATAVEYARIQRLGDRSWLVIAEPPAVVWPLLRQFLADNGVRIDAEDAGSGVLRTSWVLAEVDAADVVRRTLAGAADGAAAGTRSRLYFRLEPGIRPGTTEILLRQADESVPLAVEWPQASSVPAVESTLLTEIGAYLAADVGGPAVSYLAQRIGAEGKSRLRHDSSGRPELLLRLDFDRAWATVGQALSRAELEVTDLDRDAGVFYLQVSEADLEDGTPGMFGRWFGDGRQAVELTVREAAEGFVLATGEATPPALAERLLVVVQENAG